MKKFLMVIACLLLVNFSAQAERKCAPTSMNPTGQCYPPDDPCTSTEIICASSLYLPAGCEWCTAWIYNTCNNTREEQVSWMSCPF